MLFNWKLFPGTNLQDLNLDWIINFVKMIPSRLPKFSDHHTWLVFDYSTGEYYDSGEPTGGAGEPGPPGKSPIIGVNGNWFIWNTTTETYTDTGTRAQGVQGEPGAGVASGGVAGDVLVKVSGVDFDTGWSPTPPQMGAIAHINAGNLADREYASGDYLIYNGALYKANTVIYQGYAITPGVNADLITVMGELTSNKYKLERKTKVYTGTITAQANTNTVVSEHFSVDIGITNPMDITSIFLQSDAGMSGAVYNIFYNVENDRLFIRANQAITNATLSICAYCAVHN